MCNLEQIEKELMKQHKGGHHFVDSMRWGGVRLYYAIATSDSYYVSSKSVKGLLTKVRANIPRGEPGNKFEGFK